MSGKKHKTTKYLKRRKEEKARHDTKKLKQRKLEEKIAKPSLARQAFAEVEEEENGNT